MAAFRGKTGGRRPVVVTALTPRNRMLCAGGTVVVEVSRGACDKPKEEEVVFVNEVLLVIVRADKDDSDEDEDEDDGVCYRVLIIKFLLFHVLIEVQLPGYRLTWCCASVPLCHEVLTREIRVVCGLKVVSGVGTTGIASKA